MKLIICEDNKMERKALKLCTEKLIKKQEMAIDRVLLFSTPAELLQTLSGERNIYLLDINLGAGLTGIETAKIIKQKDKKGKILFLTGYEDYAIESINSNTEPYAFIVKEVGMRHQSKLEETIIQIYHAIKKEEQREGGEEEQISFYDSEKRLRVFDKTELLYIENFSRLKKVKLNFAYGSFFVNTYISQIKEKFTENSFFSEHRSYIINLDQLNTLDIKNNVLEFKDGQFLFLHASVLRKIQKQFYKKEEGSAEKK